MKKTLFLMPILAFGLAACETENQNAAAGAVTGAALGAAVSGSNDRVTGAALGAAAGVAASTLVRPRNAQGNCIYSDANGRQYTARC